jgi:uncharacterized membrane protein
MSGVDEARNDIQPAVTESGFSLTVKRNCSISPQALAVLLALTAGFAFAIGSAFALYGAWPILPFAGLEIAALAAAFYLNGRRAADYERIALEAGLLVVEARDGERVATHRFNPQWVRLETSGTPREVRLALRSQGRELEIGRHLDAPGRERLAQEVRGRLAQARTARIQFQTGSR